MTDCCQKRKICHANGTGEQVLMFGYTAKEGCEAKFDAIVQEVAHGFYNMKTGIRDLRVCHPREGEVAFCITFTGKEDMEKFKMGPASDAYDMLKGVMVEEEQKYTGGCLMPDCHSLASLIDTLKQKLVSKSYNDHDVEGVRKEICKWYPRDEEWRKFVHWDESPHKYTRNLMFSNEFVDVILMCWPPGCKSSIHDHDESSCWAYCVEGQVSEVQYHIPKFDSSIENNKSSTAVGRCTALREKCVSHLRAGDCAYVRNDIGLHMVCNNTDKPAYTMHIYAPGLRRFKIFAERGDVSIHTLAEPPMTSVAGVRTSTWTDDVDPEGVIDFDSWNSFQLGRQKSSTNSECDSGSSA
eukprot:TRINITY_DN3617_c0_g1_i1.p1 TRINITY_DN3617_c0_g1~~TRINITY_DN3617_c0_g1_i1.p1  ORF type:complete len:353 (+),score=90.55 TRINITY_DN3617_c0_g1_i1:63-1121(+)